MTYRKIEKKRMIITWQINPSSEIKFLLNEYIGTNSFRILIHRMQESVLNSQVELFLM